MTEHGGTSGPAQRPDAPAWRSRALAVAAGLAVAVAIAFRLYALGRLPGINGDEAWYGVQIQRLLAGEPVDWRTPNGNLPGPVHMLLLLAVQAVAPNSLAVLRLPAVLASLGQLALTWVVVKRGFGARAAAYALVLTAVLPIDIAYARFGWDPSHSGLVAIAATGAALAGVAWATAALFLLALLVHPTNVFLAPFLCLAFLGADAARLGWRRAAARSAVVGAILAAGAAALALLSGSAAAAMASRGARAWLAPSEWGSFATRFAQLLSGDTVFEYIVGAGLGAARVPANVCILLGLAGLLALGGRRIVARSPGAEAGVVSGWLATLVAFFVLAGPEAMRPHVERYAVVLVVPTVVAVAVLLRELDGWSRLRALPEGIVAAVAVLALTAFAARYLVSLEETGSTSHPTFWTGPVEPKAEAFRRVAAEAGEAGARVVAEDYWTYWALAYLAEGSPVRVVRAEELRGAPPAGGTYWIGYAGGPLEAWAIRNPWALPRFDVAGAGGSTILRAWWTPAGPEPLRAPARGGAAR